MLADKYQYKEFCQILRGGGGGPPRGILGKSPPGIYNSIFTGIYLPTFREGTDFIIKTVSFMSGDPYGPMGVLSDFEGGRGAPQGV